MFASGNGLVTFVVQPMKSLEQKRLTVETTYVKA